MLDYEKSNISTVDVDVVLGDRERSVLASFVNSEGFDVVQTLMEDVIRDFNAELLATDVKDAQQVIANHVIAKTAGLLYRKLMDRIRRECEQATRKATNLGTIENPENINAEDFR